MRIESKSCWQGRSGSANFSKLLPRRPGCVPNFLVRRPRRGKPSNRGSRSSGSFRFSIRWRAGRWRPLSASGIRPGSLRFRRRPQRIRSLLASRQRFEQQHGVGRDQRGAAMKRFANDFRIFCGHSRTVCNRKIRLAARQGNCRTGVHLPPRSWDSTAASIIARVRMPSSDPGTRAMNGSCGSPSLRAMIAQAKSA